MPGLDLGGGPAAEEGSEEVVGVGVDLGVRDAGTDGLDAVRRDDREGAGDGVRWAWVGECPVEGGEPEFAGWAADARCAV